MKMKNKTLSPEMKRNNGSTSSGSRRLRIE